MILPGNDGPPAQEQSEVFPLHEKLKLEELLQQVAQELPANAHDGKRGFGLQEEVPLPDEGTAEVVRPISVTTMVVFPDWHIARPFSHEKVLSSKQLHSFWASAHEAALSNEHPESFRPPIALSEP